MMDDKIFGKLVYNGGWTKREKIKFWGKENDIKIVISAYENEEPNSAQRDSYVRLKADLDEISNISLKKLKKYMKDIEGDIIAYANVTEIPKNVFDIVDISEILFMENGSFGIMCNAKWDSHGIAVLCKECEVEVGPQDIVWMEE